MLEHSGGSPRVGFVTTGHDFEAAQVVEWDPCSLDSIGDILAEQQAAGRDLEAFLLGTLRNQIQDFAAQAVRGALDLIRSSRKPGLAADQIAWVSGIAFVEGETVSTLAAKHNITKQAFAQGSEKFRAALNLRSQSRRPDSLRAILRQSHRPSVASSGI